MKRRDFIKALPLGVAAAGIPFSVGGFAGTAFGRSPLFDALLSGSDTSDRVLVLINLQGGNDGLNTVIPFQDSLYDKSRPAIGFTSSADKSLLQNSVLSTSVSRQDLALNPNMTSKGAGGIASFYDLFKSGKVAVINNVGYPDPSRSHFRSTDIWNTASDSNLVLTTGWVGRWLESQYPQYPLGVQKGDDPIALTIGGSLNPVFQGSKSGMGIAVTDPSHYTSAAASMDEAVPNTSAGAELSYVRNIFLQSDVYGQRFTSLFQTPPTNKVTYPSTSIATQLKKISWCITRGMKTKVYFAQLGGFDTHINQNSRDRAAGQGLLLGQLADAIAAFQADMEASGQADRVIGMTYSEFGRRVNENASSGTDHGTCAPQFVFGSGVNGEVYGANPNLTNLDANGDLVWNIDFRQLYAGVLGDWFGVSQPLRKAILMDKAMTGESFSGMLPVNGAATTQSLIRNPASDVSGPNEADLDFALYQNYPNPFTNSTTIKFSLARTMPVRLQVYSSRGEEVQEIVHRSLGRGEYEFPFFADRLASGTYLCRLEAGEQVLVKQMKVVR